MSDEGAHEGRLSEDLSEERGNRVKEEIYIRFKVGNFYKENSIYRNWGYFRENHPHFTSKIN